MNDDVNDLIMAGGAPSAKFPTVGTVHRGPILAMVKTQQTDIDGTPKFWPNNDPMMQAVVTIQTDTRDPDIDDDDGQRRLFVKGQMVAAIRDAVKKAGAPGLALGGMLAVAYVEDGEKKAGKSAQKIYRASYLAPAGVLGDDLLAGTTSSAPAGVTAGDIV